MWFRKKLTELNSIEFYQILKLRIDTFVVEQERSYHELDDKDLEAVHVFHTNKDGEIDAYARVFVEDEHLVFGRVVTAKSSRGKGLGGQLIREILSFCAEKWQERKLKLRHKNKLLNSMRNTALRQLVSPFYLSQHLTLPWFIRQIKLL